MCRSDVAPEAAPLLAALLDEMGAALAERYGADRAAMVIGPVDFGEPAPEPEAAR